MELIFLYCFCVMCFGQSVRCEETVLRYDDGGHRIMHDIDHGEDYRAIFIPAFFLVVLLVLYLLYRAFVRQVNASATDIDGSVNVVPPPRVNVYSNSSYTNSGYFNSGYTNTEVPVINANYTLRGAAANPTLLGSTTDGPPPYGSVTAFNAPYPKVQNQETPPPQYDGPPFKY